jgi:hypothetical protein
VEEMVEEIDGSEAKVGFGVAMPEIYGSEARVEFELEVAMPKGTMTCAYDVAPLTDEM